MAQRVGTTDDRVALSFRASGTVQATLARSVGGVETTLATYSVPGSHIVGTPLTVRFDVSGIAGGATTLRAKVWLVGVSDDASASSTASSTAQVDDLWVGSTGTSSAPLR